MSHILLNTCKASKSNIFQYMSAFPLTTSSIKLKNVKDLKDESFEDQNSRNLKAWRENLKYVRNSSNYLDINSENKYFKFWHELTVNPWELKDKIKILSKKKLISIQKYDPERNEILGSDLSAAYFLIYQGGKCKFKGMDQWIKINDDQTTVNLPNTYDPRYIIVEIDASNVILYYEGLENFRNLPRVKRAIFARSPEFNDWFLDKITSLFPNLEYLDVSYCPKLTERGLESLYKLSHLKKIIITNHYKSVAFELTCMMLEDIFPQLQIKILVPEEIKKIKMNTLN